VPIRLAAAHPTLVIRREAFEAADLSRAALDTRLGLTPEEFQVERGLVCIGPIMAEDELSEVIADLEGAGLRHFEDFFDLSGNWPPWLQLFVAALPAT
jgi:hypothetical protein